MLKTFTNPAHARLEEKANARDTVCQKTNFKTKMASKEEKHKNPCLYTHTHTHTHN